MNAKGFVALLALIFLVPYGVAQTAQATPAPGTQNPTVVTNVDEVTLDLVVRNKKNKPVLDLKPGDIAVTDSGSQVNLSDLRLVSTKAGADHLVTLVFDQLDPSAATNARDVARKILKIMPATGFSYAVLSIEGRLRLFQEFTTDRSAIDKAINKITTVDEENQDKKDTESASAIPEKQLIAVAQTGTDPSGATVSPSERAIARVTLAGIEESQRIVQQQHAQPSLSALLALARTQRKITGRKVVIYFTNGIQIDSNATDMLHSIAGAANRASVSFYVIDKNALDSKVMQGLLQTAAIGSMMSANRMNAPTGAVTSVNTQIGANQPPGMQTSAADQLGRFEADGASGSRKDPLAELATSTRGAYLMSEDNLKKPFRQLIEDMTTYYEASYVPPKQEYDGQFRPVTVKAVRTGLKMEAQAGYFAIPPVAGIRPFEAPLMKVLSEPQLPTDVKFHAAVLRLGDLPEGNENAVVVQVPVSELKTQDDPNSNLYSLHVSIVAQIKNKAGAVVEHFSEDVPRHGALDSKGSAQGESITMQRHFVAAPGEYVMEAVILDHNSGKASAQRTEFTVPDESNGASLSDLAVVQRMDPVPDADMDSAEPMKYGKGIVVPNLSGQLSHGTKEISFFFVVHPDASSATQPRLEMEVLKSGEPIAQVPLQLRTVPGAEAIPYLASIQSSSLPSGEYSVIGRVTQNGKTAERAVNFTIEGAKLAAATSPGVPDTRDSDDSEVVSTAQLHSPEARQHLVITSLPAGAVPAPSAGQLDSLVENARKRALEYSKALPNFICVEVTNRSVDQSGNGNWKARDSIAELLSYRDGQETRSTLEVNGQRSSLKRTEMNSSWPLSVGEFGALLKLVFAPASKTTFEWKEAATLGDGTAAVQVLNYRVARENATIDLGQGNETVGVGFHGLVYVDSATNAVRRITVEADGLPEKFSMRGASMTVDYDFVAISGRDYMLPVRSTVSIRRHHKVELNEIAFRNYRRFASRTKIKFIQ